jgi:hypothetical protein
MNAKLKALAAEWWPDSLMVAGAAAVSYGAGQVYTPAGWIVAGVLLVVGGVLGSRR